MRKSNWESFLQIFETTTKRNSACLTSLKFIELKHLSALQMMNHPKRYHNNITPTLLQLPPQKKGRKPQKTYDKRVQPNECLLQQCDYTTSACFLDHVHNAIQLGHMKHTNLGSAWPPPRVGGIACEIFWAFRLWSYKFDGPKKLMSHILLAITGHTYWCQCQIRGSLYVYIYIYIQYVWMLKSNWIISPEIGMKIPKNIWSFTT